MLVEENTVSVPGLAWVRALGCAGGCLTRAGI